MSAPKQLAPKLVVRNTFLELSDDTTSSSPAPRRRAHTDMTAASAKDYGEDMYYNGGNAQMASFAAQMGVGGLGFGGQPDGKGGVGPFGVGNPLAAWDPMAAAALWNYSGAAYGYGFPPQGMPYPYPPYFDPNAMLGHPGYPQAPERKGSGSNSQRNDRKPSGNAGANACGKGSNQRAHGATAATASSGANASASSKGAIIGVDSDTASTVMLRNIPNRYTQTMLVALVEEQGFKHVFDFIYLPMDFRNGVNLGYAFVNLTSNADALRLTNLFTGFTAWSCDSDKVCEVSWAHPNQGLDEHVERYRNSPVMHHCMPAEYKPILFKNGTQIPFPPPTKPIKAPKLRPARERDG